MEVPYAPRLVSGGWVVAGWAGLAYGVYLTVLALRSPPGTDLTGHWVLQPPFKASMALLLTVAAVGAPDRPRAAVADAGAAVVGHRRLVVGDPVVAAVVRLGLAAFLLAHLCFLGALLPLAPRRRGVRMAAVVVMCLVFVSLLAWFWPHLGRDKLTIPVTVYIVVLTAMVCTALLAELPTIWTAVGAVCFAASDAMIAIGRFILGNEALAVPIWWSYAAAQILITAGFFFGREAPR